MREPMLMCLGLVSACVIYVPAKTRVAPKPTTARAPRPPVPLAAYLTDFYVDYPEFSHDDQRLAYHSDRDGRHDVWIAPLDGGKPRRLTHINGMAGGFNLSPVDDSLVFEADAGGNGAYRLYLDRGDGQGPKDLFPGDRADARSWFVRWCSHRPSFLYASNRVDRRLFDLYEYELTTGASERVFQSTEQLAASPRLLASADCRRFVLVDRVWGRAESGPPLTNANLYLVERGKPGAALLTQHEGNADYSPEAFSADRKTLYYLSNQEGEFTALYSMDLASKARKVVLRENWEVVRAYFSPTRKYFITKIAVDGEIESRIEEVATGKRVSLPPVPAGSRLVPSDFSSDDRYVACRLVSDSAPPAIVVVDLQTGNFVYRVARDPPAGATMVRGEAVRIRSFDRWSIPAFVYRPKGPGPHPAIIDVHGGPTAQSWRSFDPARQYFVSKGYVVLVPNVRGSTGYGKSYERLDDLDLGGEPLWDVVACKQWLVDHAEVDKDRVVVMGGSYGGYMALAAAAFTPTSFVALVDLFGVSDIRGLTQDYGSPEWGHPKLTPGYQYNRSPLHFVDKIQRPILVVHSENDPIVRPDQSDRFVAKLRARQNRAPVHFFVLPGEGHGWSSTASLIQTYELIDRFLDRYVFGDTTVSLP